MSVLTDHLNQILNVTNSFLYGSVLLVLLLSTGICSSARTRIVQFRMAREETRLLFQDNDNKEVVSGSQALMVSCASRLGVGNITSMTSTIILGGPGVILWVWTTTALDDASAFVENTLAQLYKVKTPEGGSQGGPSYYLVKIFRRRWVGVVFVLSLIITFSYGSQILQVNVVTVSLQRNLGDSSRVVYSTTITMTLLTSYVAFGGQKIIVKVSEVIVPSMAVGFLLVSLAVIALNVQRLPYVFNQIFPMVFNSKSASGGFSGTAISIGLCRDLYSNEASMGSVSNAVDTADDTHPTKQGPVQMLAVHIDTLTLCTVTALLVLCPGVSWEGKDGGYAIPLIQVAVESQFGAFGLWLVSISVFFFVLGTTIGNVYYVEINVYYIWHRAPSRLFRLSIVAIVCTGCLIIAELARNLVDSIMAIMVLLNFPTLVILADTAIEVLKDYEAQKRQGKERIYFYAPSIGIHDTDCWNVNRESEPQAVPARTAAKR